MSKQMKKEPLPPGIREYFSKLAREGALKMSVADRKIRASKGGKARWAKHRENKENGLK